MPVHALVTRLPRSPDPAAALACDRVTWSRQRPPQGTLTLLAAAAWHLRVTMVTSRTPGQGDHGRKERIHYDCCLHLEVSIAFNEDETDEASGRGAQTSHLSQYLPSYPSGQAVHR